MKIGLYFGTFNPIHIGHLVIANHITQYTDVDEVWMVITPHSPLKKKKGLLEDYHRLHMVHLATESYDQLKASDIEFSLPQPNYTIDTMAYLHEKHPNHEFCLIMGEDNLDSFHKWKNYELLLERYSLIVYPRVYKEKKQLSNNTSIFNHSNVQLVSNAPIMEISSTFIREAIKDHKDIRPLIDSKVWGYINHNLFYKK